MISVIGPGGVGGLLAALLIRSGQDVTVVARAGTAERIGAEGLRVESAQFGSFTVNPTVALVPPSGAPAIVAVKQYGLADVLPDLRVAQPVEMLSLLNGLAHAPLIHAAVPESRAVNGSINVVSERREDGVIEHPVDFSVVNVPRDAGDLALVSALEAAGVTVNAEGSEHEVLWKKLRFLAPMALLTSWADAPLGEALAREPDLTRGVVEEVAALANAEGVSTDSGRILRYLEGVEPTAWSSLALDVRRGGPTELAAIGDDLIYRADSRHLAVPHLQRVVNAIGARLE
ncbi:MAG: 2-dehydropantoate 2-reductase N-terminal domain-containing protein [bacterium]|nr:2-dehydropantoate 2-reductase N-terminal domain-containing protein [bacterium]